MPDPPDIFAKRRLTIGRLRAVADRRYGDAVALVETGDNARANGAQYLAGIVIEILLKGQLLHLHPELSMSDSAALTPSKRLVWNLIWRSHDLDEMLQQLPKLRASVQTKADRAGVPYLRWLQSVCATWTIHARYSSRTSTMHEARQMVDRVRVLKEVIQ
jgi:hypothetical protein